MTETQPDLDLRSPAAVRDPFPVYRWLRDRDPVHWSEGLSGWVVTRYRDVARVFDQPAVFSADRFRRQGERYASEREAVKAVGSVLSQWLVFRDPPGHTRLRALLQKSFTPRQLERSRAVIQATIDGLLDPFAASGRMDFIRDFAFPLPALVIATLLGAPTEDLHELKRWSDRLAAHLGGAVDERDNWTEAQAGLSSLVEYFRGLVAERRRAPRDDLMSLMLAAEHEGERLGADEVVANSVLLLFAGHETTTNLLGNGLYHLHRHPEQWQALRADPSLVPGAVEELLRFDGPVPATAKVASEDAEWHGRRIRRGDRVLPILSSANRDPRRFERPDVLDVRRQPTRHLAFGFGIHFCLGAPLARLEAQLAFDTLLRRFPELAPEPGPPRWKPMIFLRGLEALPVALGTFLPIPDSRELLG